MNVKVFSPAKSTPYSTFTTFLFEVYVPRTTDSEQLSHLQVALRNYQEKPLTALPIGPIDAVRVDLIVIPKSKASQWECDGVLWVQVDEHPNHNVYTFIQGNETPDETPTAAFKRAIEYILDGKLDHSKDF